ncbi:MAG: hypothetical protein H7Y11_11965 [Armatimonadetes bacterium]|nr:hypothetical protein [Anaerolineae bacterium]
MRPFAPLRLYGCLSLLSAVTLIACQPPAATTLSASATPVVVVANSGTQLVQQQPLQPQQQPTLTPLPPTPTPVFLAQVEFGASVDVDTTAGAAQVTFTVAEPQFVDIIARGIDGVTDPTMILYNERNHALTASDDYTARRDDLDPQDAMVGDAFLVAGVYSVRIESSGGDRQVRVSVEAGTGGALGAGQLTTIDAELSPDQRWQQTLTLAQNELISIMVLSKSPTFDPRITLRNAAGDRLAKNDDTDSADPVLDSTDAKLPPLIIPATGEYVFEVRGFSSQDAGGFQVIIQRYGVLQPVEEAPQVLTGDILSRGRLSFPLELQAGEVLNVTARAVNSLLDTQVALLDPDDVIVISNDDHGTKEVDLGRYDARFTTYVTQMDGTYTLDLESVSYRGAYQLVVERLGKIDRTLLSNPVDVTANEIVIGTPTALPDVPPVAAEQTPEVTPTS